MHCIALTCRIPLQRFVVLFVSLLFCCFVVVWVSSCWSSILLLLLHCFRFPSQSISSTLPSSASIHAKFSVLLSYNNRSSSSSLSTSLTSPTAVSSICSDSYSNSQTFLSTRSLFSSNFLQQRNHLFKYLKMVWFGCLFCFVLFCFVFDLLTRYN